MFLRRSIRNYKTTDVPENLLQRLLQVAIHAGTASNGQTEQFIVLRDRQKINNLEILVVNSLWNVGLKYFGNRLLRKIFEYKYGKELIKQYVSYHRIIKDHLKNNEITGLIFRNAPIVILVHGVKKNFLAQTNCALAIRNIELLAEAMGLGTCWVGFLPTAAHKTKQIDRSLNLPKGNTVLGALMLGYPKYSYKYKIPRKDRPIQWS